MLEPINAEDVSAPEKNSNYPDPFAAMVSGRIKRKIGNHFGINNFGINLTKLEPGAISALAHFHSKQDEFIYVLEGHPTLKLDDRDITLSPGQCYGFPAGQNIAHQLVNTSDDLVTYLEIGDRSVGDEVEYPKDDIAAKMSDNGNWIFTHKDGTPY